MSPYSSSRRPGRRHCRLRRCRHAAHVCIGGVGADEARRVHRSRRHRRRRRPDGALPAGRHRQAQPVEAAVHRRQQVGRRRRRRLPRRQGREGRSAQDHHHAVEPVHDAARHRRAVQLEGPDAGRDAGARRVRAVGERRDAVQDRAGLRRRRSRPAQNGQFKMAGTGLEAGRPDHHRRAREGHRQEDDVRAVQGRRRRRRAARRQARRLARSTTRSRRSPTGARARCGRCACSTPSRCRIRTR